MHVIWPAWSSEAGAIPVLSRNCDAPTRGMSQVACPSSNDQPSEEGRLVRQPPAIDLPPHSRRFLVSTSTQIHHLVRATERRTRRAGADGAGGFQLGRQEPVDDRARRAFRRRGIDVAPFKAQNMSNNARVVAGGESAAQDLQALAAGVAGRPHGPVLVKPEGENRSQSSSSDDLTSTCRQAWRERPPSLWPVIDRALQACAPNTISCFWRAPAVRRRSICAPPISPTSHRSSRDAHVILVADIDRGGAFAHLYGTWSLLGEAERARLSGFVLNKFAATGRCSRPGRRNWKN